MNARHLSFDGVHLVLASFYTIQSALASYIKTGANEFQADVILIAAIVGYMMLHQAGAILSVKDNVSLQGGNEDGST